MNLTDIIQLTSTVGFPIVAYFFMSQYNRELQAIINNLTATLASMNERIGNIEDKVLTKKKEVD